MGEPKSPETSQCDKLKQTLKQPLISNKDSSLWGEVSRSSSNRQRCCSLPPPIQPPIPRPQATHTDWPPAGVDRAASPRSDILSNIRSLERGVITVTVIWVVLGEDGRKVV